MIAYLRSLQDEDAHDPRRTIAAVFKEVTNRMQSGHLLRDVINKVNGIHFNSSEEMHTLSRLYELLLKEMRDAAGDSGEFYTPRAVVRFMVEVNDPRLGETVLDPACGTGGFLVEAYQHLEKQCRKAEHRRTLQQASIQGGEAKPLPFMLAQMNLLLHGLEVPQIILGNSLAVKLSEIGDRDRVDVLLTAPLFGGEEEYVVRSNFPEDKQTSETNLLFLQLTMRKLRRRPPGRAGIIVSDGVLFSESVAARVKEELLTQFNLHAIARLPKGVFAPYSTIATNLLFFDRSGPTRELWYYEMPLPAGRKNYSKTAPLQYEEFADCLAWWKQREENAHAWCVDFGLKYKNARAAATPHWEAAQAADAKAKELARELREVNDELRGLREQGPLFKQAPSNAQALKKLEARRDQLQAAELSERERAKQEQAAGDALYWPIFNLDSKNPAAKTDFEHLPPEQLADDILRKEQRIAELMAEIKQALLPVS